MAFQALGDSTRRQIFERLLKKPMAVVDLAGQLPVSRPAVSQHLKILKTAGLVGLCQQGTRNVYYVDPKGVQAMREYLDGMWDSALQAFKLAAEQERKK
ncbi:MAG: transcriptional regulator [Bdellovibrio sp.]|nr:MAG: transcriptional regulator [Bdellovibrio sp.]